jgi:hypothetical protein
MMLLSRKIPIVIAASMGDHRAAISQGGRAFQNGGLSSFRPKSCGGEYHTERQPGLRQETVMWPPCLAPEQLQGSHPHVTMPGPQRCPCWQWVGYDHQSGSESCFIHPLERPDGRCDEAAGYRTQSNDEP